MTPAPLTSVSSLDYLGSGRLFAPRHVCARYRPPLPSTYLCV